MSSTSRQVRGRREGTIIRRRDGRWEIRVQDPLTGQRRSRYAKSEAAARKVLREMNARAERGELVADSAQRLETFCQHWLADSASHGRRPSTVREYRRRLTAYVLPELGSVRLDRLTVSDVERLLAVLAARGLGVSSVRGTRNALSAVLGDAQRARLVRDNVAGAARLPLFAPAPVTRTATAADAARLVAAAQGTALGPLVSLLAGTGCRIGEALGARWSDVDLVAATWVVSRTTTLDANGRVVIGERTKSGAARVVPLIEPVVQALREQRAAVAASRLRAGQLWVDNDLLFPTSVGTPQDSRNLRHSLRDLQRRADFPGSFHALRHVFATVAAGAVPLVSLSKVLGHQKTATTSDLYAHLYAPSARAAVDAVGAAMFGTQG